MTSQGFHPRRLHLRPLLRHRSVLLTGPRQTGKSRLLRESLPDAVVYDLLDPRLLQRLLADPGRLADELGPSPDPNRVIVIDEVQRIPALLDVVHHLIESKGLRFVLTGSSARALKRPGVNRLGGRAWVRSLHPLVRAELGSEFDLTRALRFGTLPPVWSSPDPAEDLRAYVGTYLREEVAAEGLVRSLPAFARFLEVAGAADGQLVNKTQMASDAMVPRTTIHEYFEILKDCLLARELLPLQGGAKRKPIQTSKFYFFDVGVARALAARPLLQDDTVEFGAALEAFLHHELSTWIDTDAPGMPLHFWRAADGHEVDFVLDGGVAVEVKAARTVKPSDIKGLLALGDDRPLLRRVVVCREATRRMLGPVEVVPWAEFLDELWGGGLRR